MATITQAVDTCAVGVVTQNGVTLALTGAVDTCAATVLTSGQIPQSDFDARKSAVGVVRWFDFDTVAQLGSSAYGANVGYGSNSGDTLNYPVIDTDVKASGTGSMRFDIRSQSFHDGSWYANFSADLLTQFGANSHFFVQWRQRFNSAFVTTAFLEQGGGAQGGIKQAIITTGDQPGRIFASCESIGNVIQTYYQSRFPIAYNSCTGSGSHGPYSGFYEVLPGDFGLQNADPTPYCRYSQVASGVVPPAGCFGWHANEWMTFQAEVLLGDRNLATDDFNNSEFRLWGMRDPAVVPGAVSQLLVDWKPGVGGYFPLAAGTVAKDEKFGKIVLLPYMTNKDPTQVTALCQTWYDEVIISTNRIADPGAPPSFPAWRNNMTVGALTEIGSGTAKMGGIFPVADTGGNDLINGWGGFASSSTKVFTALSTGHGAWYQPVGAFDLSVASPAWASLDMGSNTTAKVDTALGGYYTDDRPTASHIYYTVQYVSNAGGDGVDRVFRFTGQAIYSLSTPQQIPNVDSFRLDTNIWEGTGNYPSRVSKWASFPNSSAVNFPAVGKHPTTQDIYYFSDEVVGLERAYRVWSRATGTWSAPIVPTPSFPSLSRLPAWTFYPALVDAQRTQFVCLTNDTYIDTGLGLHLSRINLTTNVHSNLKITGETFNPYGAAFVLDTDSNLYYAWVCNADSVNVLKVYQINPDTGVATLYYTSSNPLHVMSAGGTNTPLSRVQYFSSYNGFVYGPNWTSPLYFMPVR